MELDSIQSELVALGVSTGLVTVLIQKLKTWFSMRSDKLITLLLLVFAVIAGVANYLMTTNPESLEVLGEKTAYILAFSIPLYRYVVKSGSQILKDAREMRVSRKSASVPAPIEQQDLVTQSMEFDPDLAEPVQPVENLDQ